jgi:2-polyprenyl-6-methoxyphenol hydroxylase-like FAD-dependent oxidoreductase|tara:strand:+ start:3345 stop:3572 length:228 start_codon:yes stop_codon:yes gene_type:complete
MARQLEADIIIKGAGPVGLSMANLLGVYDNRTLVLKQNATTVEEPRAIALVLRTAAHCNPWDSKKNHICRDDPGI